MDLETCKKKFLVKSIKPDLSKIQALLKSSLNKQEASEALPDQFPDSKITLLYDSLRILLEYHALNQGFKIYNHECYTAFLKEILKESQLGDEFDKFRKVRNAINYYGKEISKEEAREILSQMKDFIAKIKPKE